MKLFDRARQLRESGKHDYMLWEAHPNEWHKGCYVLDLEYGSKNFSGSIMTYFYTDGSGPTLAQAVEKHTKAHLAQGFAF